MARSFKIDSVTGDLDFSGGTMQVVDDAPAIAQAVKIGLSTFLTEWFLDLEVGIPYYEQIFVKAPNFPAVREIFRRDILDTPGVNEVLSLDLNYTNATRKLDVGWRASTDFGEITQETT